VNSSDRLASVAVVLSIILYCLPEREMKSINIAGVGLIHASAFMVVVGAGLGLFWRSLNNGTAIVIFTFLAVLMILLSLLPKDHISFDLRMFLADTLIFCGLIAGVVYGQSRTPAQILRCCRWMAVGCMAAIVVSLMGLLTGFIEPVFPGRRPHVWALFNGTWILAVLAPALAVVARKEAPNKTKSMTTSSNLIWIAYLLIAFVFAYTGTRSVGIQLFASLLVTWMVLGSFFSMPKIVGPMIVAALLSPFVNDSFFEEKSSLLRERMTIASMDRDMRLNEAQDMASQAGDFLWLGCGFGSTFESPIIWQNESSAAALHIGVLTFPFKGGFLAVLCGLLWPFFIAVRLLFRARRNTMLRLACGNILLYIVFASVSGGWTFFSLFLYGTFIGIAFRHWNVRALISTPVRPISVPC